MHSKQTILSPDITLPVPTNESYELWGVWGDEVNTGASSNHSTSKTTRNQQRTDRHQSHRKQNQPEQEQLNDVNYFQELSLEPEIKKAKKIVVKRNDITDAPSRLAMVNDIPLSNDLGTLEDRDIGGGWSEEEEEGDAVKDKRRLERERRIQEHQRKKLEKDRQRKKQLGASDQTLTHKIT